MRISVVLPHVNEPSNLNATIKSIRATAGNEVEIVVVDDCSTTRPEIIGADTVIFNRFHCGAGPSRHIGAEAATGTHILITDCHMQFLSGWHQAAIDRIKDRPTTVNCGVCLAIDDKHPDASRPRDRYYGATFNFYGPDKFKPGATKIFSAVWNDRQEGDDYELPACMGACYFMPRDWYLKLSPHKHLVKWGVEEEALSLKTWLAGGEIRMMKTVQIAHKFRLKGTKLPFSLKVDQIIYNQLFVAYTCLPEPYADALMKKFPREMNFSLAYQKLRENWGLMLCERAYNQRIFTRSFDWLLDHFGLTCPL